ncbi:hypothetical protein BISA_1764 [Bifidobacterium saguini DSM 23967]|uniref:Cryptic prophage protein n=2 Tax=Bifidobacterium saguini TaxID=762210 RepID=A0A087D6L7_9BIFI|nr:hypothetical protein [Bifidobacterium saguini]KFI91167.1 hypothetical protein BISA_1764 [Bifidobacterium saguini DSM 23967]QTB91134.1 hypothetical protein BSD967_01420 [Bifidobacterium saguini]
MNGKVQEAIDWRTAKPAELDGARCILMTQDGTIIDGRLKASWPRDGYQATRFTLDDSEETLKGMRILSVNPKHGTAILQPHIKTLTVLKG